MAGDEGAVDPRDRVTEQAFRVDPGLLDVPLATPFVRLIAIGMDLLAAAVLARTLGVFLLFVAGFMFLRSSLRSAKPGTWVRVRRWALGIAGVLAVGLGLLAYGIVAIAPTVGEALRARELLTKTGTGTATLGPKGVEILEQLSSRLPREAREDLLADLAELSTSAKVQLSTASATISIPGSPDLHIDLDEVVEDRAEREPDPDPWTVPKMFERLLETFGLTIGWIGAYFTILLAMGKGQTPGKRILRIRVVRLDGRPIGFWDAFERFSGLGAGLATGLLGFLQVYWDRNRQAIHDKISNTVVISERGKGRRPRADLGSPPHEGDPPDPDELSPAAGS